MMAGFMPPPSSAPQQEAQASGQASGQAPSGEEAQASVPSEPPAIALPDLPMVEAEEAVAPSAEAVAPQKLEGNKGARP